MGMWLQEMDALPHVKLNQATLARMWLMFIPLVQRSVETETYRVHNLSFVMMQTTLEAMVALLLVKSSQVGNALEQKDQRVLATNFYVEMQDSKLQTQKYVMTEIQQQVMDVLQPAQ